jgi:hypothetical protein
MSELISAARIDCGWLFEMREAEETVQIRLRADESDFRNLGIAEPDTERAVRTLGDVLLERQRADDLPPLPRARRPGRRIQRSRERAPPQVELNGWQLCSAQLAPDGDERPTVIVEVCIHFRT